MLNSGEPSSTRRIRKLLLQESANEIETAMAMALPVLGVPAALVGEGEAVVALLSGPELLENIENATRMALFPQSQLQRRTALHQTLRWMQAREITGVLPLKIPQAIAGVKSRYQLPRTIHWNHTRHLLKKQNHRLHPSLHQHQISRERHLLHLACHGPR